MKMLTHDSHKIGDYIVAALMVLSPFVLGFADVPAARNVMLITGVVLALYSWLTGYHYALHRLPFNLHRAWDWITGGFIAYAPQLFGTRPQLDGFQEAIHYVFGAILIAIGVFTRTERVSEDVEENDRERVGRAS